MDAAVTAQHSGAINHIHSFHFSSSALDLAREARNIVAVVVVGWVAVVSIGALRSTFRKDGGNS